MDKFGKSQPVRRFEDQRFLTGQGGYLDDVAPEGALYAYFLRSSVAHADIDALDTADAAAAPGVHLVLTAADLEAAGVKIGMNFTRAPNHDGTQGVGPERPVLARNRVRFVGEPIALIVADSLNAAKDAAELVGFDYTERDVHLAIAPGGPAVHDEAPDNVAFDYGVGDAEATEAAFASAARVVELEIGDNRVICNSMEPRGAIADWDGERLHFTVSGQGVWGPKADLSEKLGLEPEAVHVVTPDVGGGFGMKAFVYPEYVPIAHASRVLGRPVRWTGERGESMLTDNAGRDLTSKAALAFDETGKILAYRVETLSNLGAYCSNFAQMIQSFLFARVLTGTYDIQTVSMRCKGIFTNTTQVDAYRGAGRPEAIFVIERLMEHAAEELGIDPWELRRKNFIPPAAFPYKTQTGETYDVGDFARVLARVETECDRAGFAARRAASEAKGKLRGMGLSFYIESILGDPGENVQVEFHEDGTASIYVGTQSNGQGHETAFAQFLADQTGIPAELISVVQGDSDRIAAGGGTGGSRSVTVQTNATLVVVEKMVEAFSAFFAEEAGVAPEDVSFDDTTFRAEGSNQTPTMLELAQMAREKGRDDLLSFKDRGKLPGRSFPNGAHVAEVEIDRETGEVSVERYTVTDDFGFLINPMLAEGQVHGGVVQGIGQALTEHVVFDETGQPLTASFMDYAMPRADTTPMIGFTTEPVPSTANQMGIKGCGEAGTVGALAAVANAVRDATRGVGAPTLDMPFTPERVWQALNPEPIAAE